MKYSLEDFKKVNILIGWRYKSPSSPSVIPAKITRIPTKKGYAYYIQHNCKLFAHQSWVNVGTEYRYYIPLGDIDETNPKDILYKVLVYFSQFLSSHWLYESLVFQPRRVFKEINI